MVPMNNLILFVMTGVWHLRDVSSDFNLEKQTEKHFYRRDATTSRKGSKRLCSGFISMKSIENVALEPLEPGFSKKLS